MNYFNFFISLFFLLFCPLASTGGEQSKTRRQVLIERKKSRQRSFHTSNLSRRYEKKCSKEKLCVTKGTTYCGEDYSIHLSSDWQCIEDKQQLPEKIDLLFIGKGISSLTPTINVASELTQKNSTEYAEEIISYHLQDPNTFSSSVFSTVRSPCCEFIIIKTEKNSCWGQVVFLQAVTVKNRKVYLFNCMSAWDDFPSISQEFLKTVTSFQLKEGRDMSGDEILEQALRGINK
ncbi:hypothetical protein [Chlamydiifrater volucris]|uniref:hypothetical protein n=1 Tax=Chlamydiifrater volucris TaxID=2681470 RepID=UPI001BD062AB|nr:hypothetical protein [Chlamydiifrater volucris]